MVGIPPRLLANLAPADILSAETWWAGLSEADRAEVLNLWDNRQDRCLFGLAPYRDGAAPPVVIGGRFVPRDDAAGWAEWQAEYFEYLLNHSEDVFEPTVIRTFYIGCTRHEAARAVLASGRIPADFRCPLAEADCPLEKFRETPHHRSPVSAIQDRTPTDVGLVTSSGNPGDPPMRIEFRAAEGGFEEDEYVLICGVSGNDADGIRHSFHFQRGPEDEPPEEDWGVYAEFDDQGYGGYRRIQRCRLTRDRLSVDLSGPLGHLTGVEGFDVSLAAIDDPSYEQLRAELPRIFRGMPDTLEID